MDETLTHSTWKPRYVDETLTHSMWMTQSQSVWGCFPFFLPLAVSDSYNLDPLYVDETLTHSTWKPRYVDETLTHSMWMTQSQSVWGCFPFLSSPRSQSCV